MVNDPDSPRPEWPLFSLLAVLALLVVGGLLRFSHADWDGGCQLHPDERGILFIAQTITLPRSVGDFWAVRTSPLNPFRGPDGSERHFAYGHLPLYLTVATGRVFDSVCEAGLPVCGRAGADSFVGRLLNTGGWPRFTHLAYVGRALSALYDALTILVVALLAAELFDHRAAVLSAAFLTFAVLHIQNAHFGTVDTALSLFSTLTVWLLARYSRTTHLRDALFAGMGAGLAVGSKFTAALLFVPLLAAHLTVQFTGERKRPEIALVSPRAFWLTLLGLFVTFALTNPYALLDPAPFFTETITQSAMGSGSLDWVFTRQYAGTVPLWYHVDQQARWLLGLPLTVSACVALVWVTRRAVRSRSRQVVVVLSWVYGGLLLVGFQYAKFPRYLLPFTPVLLVFAGGMFSLGWGDEAKSGPLLKALGGLVVLLTGLYAAAFVSIYREPHPWVAASEWIYRNIPPDTVIAVEYWDDPLPMNITVDGKGCQRDQVYRFRLLDPFAEPDDLPKLQQMLDDLAASDLLVLSSSRLYGVIPRLPGRYPCTAKYYRALFRGDLGFVVLRSFTRRPSLFGVSLIDDAFTRPALEVPPGYELPTGLRLGFADESFTVYDHPLVLVFENRAHLSADAMQSIISCPVPGDR